MTAASCTGGEFIGVPLDVCAFGSPKPLLAAGAGCAAAGLAELDICAPNGVCLAFEGPLVCTYLCSTSEGGYFEPNLPDCGTETAVCYALQGIDAFGVCLGP
jgi:hypothetical protein